VPPPSARCNRQAERAYAHALGKLDLVDSRLGCLAALVYRAAFSFRPFGACLFSHVYPPLARWAVIFRSFELFLRARAACVGIEFVGVLFADETRFGAVRAGIFEIVRCD